MADEHGIALDTMWAEGGLLHTASMQSIIGGVPRLTTASAKLARKQMERELGVGRGSRATRSTTSVVPNVSSVASPGFSAPRPSRLPQSAVTSASSSGSSLPRSVASGNPVILDWINNSAVMDAQSAELGRGADSGERQTPIRHDMDGLRARLDDGGEEPFLHDDTLGEDTFRSIEHGEDTFHHSSQIPQQNVEYLTRTSSPAPTTPSRSTSYLSSSLFSPPPFTSPSALLSARLGLSQQQRQQQQQQQQPRGRSGRLSFMAQDAMQRAATARMELTFVQGCITQLQRQIEQTRARVERIEERIGESLSVHQRQQQRWLGEYRGRLGEDAQLRALEESCLRGPASGVAAWNERWQNGAGAGAGGDDANANESLSIPDQILQQFHQQTVDLLVSYRSHLDACRPSFISGADDDDDDMAVDTAEDLAQYQAHLQTAQAGFETVHAALVESLAENRAILEDLREQLDEKKEKSHSLKALVMMAEGIGQIGVEK